MPADHVDVLIVGAGLSGVGAAWRLRESLPGKTFAILEARDAIGGTWDLFRYPGVRSDSDMHTLGYPFRPWRGRDALAPGGKIRDYIRATADDGGITPHIRLGARAEGADWSSRDARWTVRLAGDATMTCDFLYACTGYYDYDGGHRPDFPGLADFAGRVADPQFWPDDLAYGGKRVVVIGSGATAVTVVPAMAATAAHVTMLQRSPSYVTARPALDPSSGRLPSWLVRAKNVLLSQGFYALARRQPRQVRRVLRSRAVRELGDAGYVDKHFRPRYDPWDQRLCVVPDGDLFAAIRAGRASVVTDRIDRFVPSGIRLSDGRVLPADIVVPATGLSLVPAGKMRLTVDGKKVEFSSSTAYRGLMLGGVPNFAFCVGYVNASWTLRADLMHRYVVRLLAHMEKHGWAVATPRSPVAGGRPLLDITSGYVRRATALFPRQGERAPWRLRQSYLWELLTVPRAPVTREMTFRSVRRPAVTGRTAG